MHISATGNGPALVLLHGWGMHGGVWNEIAALLAPQFRVHSVDLPGHGRSAASEPFTLDAIVAALAENCPTPAAICGWSLGGMLALRWARLARGQVERLILMASTPRFVRGAGWESGMAPDVFDAFAQDCARDPRGVLRRFAVLQAHGDQAAREVARRLQKCVAHHPVDAATLAAGLQILRDTDLRGGLREIGQPALILHGDRDTVAPPAAGEYLHRNVRGSRLHVVAGAAHAPFIAQPEVVARAIAEFCRG